MVIVIVAAPRKGNIARQNLFSAARGALHAQTIARTTYVRALR
jgi:hypothetical protein